MCGLAKCVDGRNVRIGEICGFAKCPNRKMFVCSIGFFRLSRLGSAHFLANFGSFFRKKRFSFLVPLKKRAFWRNAKVPYIGVFSCAFLATYDCLRSARARAPRALIDGESAGRGIRETFLGEHLRFRV